MAETMNELEFYTQQESVKIKGALAAIVTAAGVGLIAKDLPAGFSETAESVKDMAGYMTMAGAGIMLSRTKRAYENLTNKLFYDVKYAKGDIQ